MRGVRQRERGLERWSRGVRQRERGSERWSWHVLQPILNCKFDFFSGKRTVGAVHLEPPLQTGIIEAAGTTAAPTNRFVGAAGD